VKRRGNRIAFTVAATGLAVALVVGILYRGVVTDHVAAWWFQLTTETMTVEPQPDHPEWVALQIEESTEEDLLDTAALPQVLADSSGRVVIIDVERRWEWDPPDIPWGKRDFTTATILEAAKEVGLRVIDQRFPQRAFVVIRDNP
jgi:hypothetical protein